jgi:hypothetical protein
MFSIAVGEAARGGRRSGTRPATAARGGGGGGGASRRGHSVHAALPVVCKPIAELIDN